MAQPDPYTRNYDFASFQSSNPTTPLPAASIESEFDEIVSVFNAILANLALLQRDDTALANGIVHQDAFSAGALALMAGTWLPRGAWATATVYAVGDVVSNSSVPYVCATAHTSGTFSTDLAAAKWILMPGSASAVSYDNATSGLDASTLQAAVDELSLMSGGYAAKDVAGAVDVTLTAAEADSAVLKFTGALTASINVIVPLEERRWIVHNATSGAFTLTVKHSTGTGVAVTQGEKAWLYGDGTNVLKLIATDDVPAAALQNLSEDTTPQLGGPLDTNAKLVQFSEGAAVASASSCDIWAGDDGNTVHITGTTAIDDFGTAPRAGAFMFVVFDGACTVNDSATITVDRNANFVAAANDMGFVYAETTTTFLFKPLPNGGFLRPGATDVLTAGFSATPYSNGTVSTGTLTPDEANGNLQYYVNGGAHILAPPTNNTTLVVQCTNNATAGAITTSGFTLVDGDSLTTTSGDDFLFYITKLNGFSRLTVTALQ